MMKRDFPRLEIITPRYRLIWHGRFFGFRLVSTVADPYDERISYTHFGPFAVGGVDLLCGHYQPLKINLPGGEEVRTGLGNLSACEPDGMFLVEHVDAERRAIRMWADCAADSPQIRLAFATEGFDEPLLLSLPGNLIYDQKEEAGATAAFYSSGAETGLRVAGEYPGCVFLTEDAWSKTLVCRLPHDRKSEWVWTVLGPKEALNRTRRVAPKPGDPAMNLVKCNPLPMTRLESWERKEQARNHWKPEPGSVKERVAGVYVTARDWNNPVSWLPEGRISYLENIFLPKQIESRSFQAVGFSRDGVTEKGENAGWLRLVEHTHRAGLRVYMKPGDGELTRLRQDQFAGWAKACFDVPGEQRCDVVRLPWEAVLSPWTTANLCLPPQFWPGEWKGKDFDGLPWAKAKDRIIAAVADRFSRIIDAIRRYAPGITIDLESADTTVIERLQERHERLGVMYMCYGQYPRATEYLDLYYSVARRQMRAARVVLETDCYYSDTITSLGALKGRPYEQMYSDQDIELMAKKHRHMNRLPAEAAWAWGTYITFLEKKLSAICQAHG